MIHHHPDDALLMSLAAGAVARGPAVVIAAHTESCPRCRTRLHEFEAVGGVLLDELDPSPLSPEALPRTLARLSAVSALEARPPAATPAISSQASWPEGLVWPRNLALGKAVRWRRLGPGVRWSRVILAEGKANLHLLRVAARKALPVHGHQGGELSQVLYGAFRDGGVRFGAGDFIEADDEDRHRPVVTEEGECICLISLDGHVAFDGPLARMLGSLLGM